ncbi:hypothetical protein QBD00_002427 [Ochrobactrum sp. AN78]|nr:hypothetical protein [Ochrobactrum sp. AN78]
MKLSSKALALPIGGCAGSHRRGLQSRTYRSSLTRGFERVFAQMLINPATLAGHNVDYNEAFVQFHLYLLPQV